MLFSKHWPWSRKSEALLSPIYFHAKLPTTIPLTGLGPLHLATDLDKYRIDWALLSYYDEKLHKGQERLYNPLIPFCLLFRECCARCPYPAYSQFDPSHLQGNGWIGLKCRGQRERSQDCPYCMAMGALLALDCGSVGGWEKRVVLLLLSPHLVGEGHSLLLPILPTLSSVHFSLLSRGQRLVLFVPWPWISNMAEKQSNVVLAEKQPDILHWAETQLVERAGDGQPAIAPRKSSL